jgi:RNA polymerase sigma-70 factor, ECF subfamily
MAINMIPTHETELVRQAKEGDNDAFSELYDAYIRKIYDFVYYKTLNKETAEDIVSLVFLKVWQNIKRYQENSFSAWLYTIARNSVIDFYRQNKNYRDIDDCWDLASEDDFISKLDNGLQFKKIREAMFCLKSLERDIIIMRFWQDLTFFEIAKRLGKSEGAIKMSLKRALDKIKGETLIVALIVSPQLINIWKKIN